MFLQIEKPVARNTAVSLHDHIPDFFFGFSNLAKNILSFLPLFSKSGIFSHLAWCLHIFDATSGGELCRHSDLQKWFCMLKEVQKVF